MMPSTTRAPSIQHVGARLGSDRSNHRLLPAEVLGPDHELHVLDRPPDADPIRQWSPPREAVGPWSSECQRCDQEVQRSEAVGLHHVGTVPRDDFQELSRRRRRISSTNIGSASDAVTATGEHLDGNSEPLDLASQRAVVEGAHHGRTSRGRKVPRHRAQVLLRAADPQIRGDLEHGDRRSSPCVPA